MEKANTENFSADKSREKLENWIFTHFSAMEFRKPPA